MNTDRAKRLFVFVGIIGFICGIGFLLILVMMFKSIISEFDQVGVFVVFSLLVFTITAFYISINSFIKYGISKGIDYAIDNNLKELNDVYFGDKANPKIL